MVLGYSEIIELIGRQKLIENLGAEVIGGCGVDLRAATFYRLKSGAKLHIKKRETPEVEKIGDGKLILKPDEYVLVETMERVNIPLDLTAIILPRSTLHRCGVSMHHALVDPGFSGTLTFGMKNISKFDFEIETGARIAQIVFEKVSGKSKEYKGKYQGGKVV